MMLGTHCKRNGTKNRKPVSCPYKGLKYFEIRFTCTSLPSVALLKMKRETTINRMNAREQVYREINY